MKTVHQLTIRRTLNAERLMLNTERSMLGVQRSAFSVSLLTTDHSHD